MAVHTAEELQHLTVKELRELAKELPGATGIHAMKKDDLVTLLSSGAGGSGAAKTTAVAPKQAKQSGAKKKPRTKSEIKSLLGELHKAKDSAQVTRDRARIEVLRRRINRLKKQTRKPQPAAA